MRTSQPSDKATVLGILHDIIMIQHRVYKSDAHEFAAFKRVLKRHEEDITWFEESGNVMIKGTGVVLINVKFDL